ncbi:MAG: tyrosine-type recombinase/integrase [Limisphaerales bacterium]
MRGLWERNGRFYAQLTVENPITGVKKVRRMPVVGKNGLPVGTAAQAIAELKRLQTKRADNDLGAVGRTPKFADYATRYLNFIASTKKAGTVDKERSTLALWIEHLRGLRVDQVKRVHVNRFVERRLKAGLSPRTANLDIISLRNVLKRAVDEGLIQRLPTEGLRPLKTTVRKRPLFGTEELEKLCFAAFQTQKNDAGVALPVTRNAQEFVDYVKLLAFSGARRNEALALCWPDVDFEHGQLTIGASGDTKNRTARVVDFNPKLRAHLRDMEGLKAPDSDWLFPSPQRGQKDLGARTFQESLKLVRRHAGMPGFTFHDCRHHFISMAVMSGVDFMTIAARVGHRDGGVWIGKVYGHLANEHRKAMAERMNLGPMAINLRRSA